MVRVGLNQAAPQAVTWLIGVARQWGEDDWKTRPTRSRMRSIATEKGRSRYAGLRIG